MDEHLLEALAGIDRPGDMFAAGDRAAAMPGLEVDGLGTVGLPLSKAQARALIRRCRQAPYGKGTQTLVDTEGSSIAQGSCSVPSFTGTAAR